MKNLIKMAAAAALLSVAAEWLGAAAEPVAGAALKAKARVLLVTGMDYPGHLWRQTAPALAEALRQDARLDVATVEDPNFLDSTGLANYDLVVLHFQNWQQPGPGPAARENLRQLVEAGRGLALVHFACGAWYGEWPEFQALAGRAWFGLQPGPGKRQHDPYGPFRVEFAKTDHPVARGLADFDTQDELYTCLAGNHPIEVIAQAKSKVDGQYYPLAFGSRYGQGRTFHCVLGHDAKALSVPGVAELYRRGCAWAAGLAPVAPMAIELDPARSELAVAFEGRKILTYRYATNQLKPYVRELYALGGGNVLRDAPPDHLHHHGLMYAITVNGTNYWEEKIAPGIEKPVKLVSHQVGASPEGLPQAQFTQLIHWLTPADREAADSAAAAVLIERRTVTVTVDEKNREVAVRWDGAFEAGKNAGRVSLQGSTYHGLGLRLPQSFDQTARFQNPADQPYPPDGTQIVNNAPWTSVDGRLEGRDLTLLMCGHPSNAPGKAFFFTMAAPFAYLSATQGLDKAPLEYGPGEKFNLHYLLTIYSEPKSREFLQQRYNRWEKSQP
jgi:uncharacterized protein